MIVDLIDPFRPTEIESLDMIFAQVTSSRMKEHEKLYSGMLSELWRFGISLA